MPLLGRLSLMLSLWNRIRQILLDLYKLLKMRGQISGILIIGLSSLLLLWLRLRRIISAVLWVVLLLSGGRRIVLSWFYRNLLIGRLRRCLTYLYIRSILSQLVLLHVLRLDRSRRRQIRHWLRWKMDDGIAILLRSQYLLDRCWCLIVSSVIGLLDLSAFPDVA